MRGIDVEAGTSNRMDSGRFESVHKVRRMISNLKAVANSDRVAQPYAFHQVMQSMFVPLQMATNARGLEFAQDLDKRIDEVGLVPQDRCTSRVLTSIVTIRSPGGLCTKRSARARPSLTGE